MKTKRGRTWLNPINNESMGSVQWSVKGIDKRSKNLNVEAMLDIADCYRHVGLEFYAWGRGDKRDGRAWKKEVERVLKKVDTLHKQISDFREALYEACEVEMDDDV